MIAEQVKRAFHVLDRFHIMKMLNEAIDKVRRSEVKRLQADGYEPILKNPPWRLLKRPENPTEKQTVKLSELCFPVFIMFYNFDGFSDYD